MENKILGLGKFQSPMTLSGCQHVNNHIAVFVLKLHLSWNGEMIWCVGVGIMGNSMVIDISAVENAVCCIHAIFFTVTAVSLLLLRLMKTTHVKRYNVPSHTSRTILMLLLVSVQVLLLLTDILSAVPRVSSYVASILTAVGTSAGLAYSDIVGRVRPLSVAVMLLLYWFTCTTLQILRSVVCLLLEPPLSADTDTCLILDTFVLLVYLSLLILECFWIVSNVSMHLCMYVHIK